MEGEGVVWDLVGSGSWVKGGFDLLVYECRDLSIGVREGFEVVEYRSVV